MTTNEVRIGNYIQVKKGKAIRIVEGFVMTEIFDGHFWNGIEYYEGIPLTPEILAKCGFEYDLITYSKGFIWLAEGNIGFDVWLSGLASGIHTNVSYLHQLQNLYFGLVKQELKIIL